MGVSLKNRSRPWCPDAQIYIYPLGKVSWIPSFWPFSTSGRRATCPSPCSDPGRSWSLSAWCRNVAGIDAQLTPEENWWSKVRKGQRWCEEEGRKTHRVVLLSQQKCLRNPDDCWNVPSVLFVLWTGTEKNRCWKTAADPPLTEKSHSISPRGRHVTALLVMCSAGTTILTFGRLQL